MDTNNEIGRLKEGLRITRERNKRKKKNVQNDLGDKNIKNFLLKVNILHWNMLRQSYNGFFYSIATENYSAKVYTFFIHYYKGGFATLIEDFSLP